MQYNLLPPTPPKVTLHVNAKRRNNCVGLQRVVHVMNTYIVLAYLSFISYQQLKITTLSAKLDPRSKEGFDVGERNQGARQPHSESLSSNTRRMRARQVSARIE